MQSSDIRAAIQNLIKENKINDTPLYSHGGFDNVDLFPIFHKLFSLEAYTALANRTQGTLHQRNDFCHEYGMIDMLSRLGVKNAGNLIATGRMYQFKRVVDRVHYFALDVAEKDIPKAVEILVIAMNDLASKSYITAALAPLMAYKFAQLPWSSGLNETRYAVISYVAVTQQGENYVQQNMADLLTKESEMPKRIEDLR